MSDKIRVEINYDAAKKYAKGGEVHEAAYIINALRKAGVPLVGSIHIMAVERGRLTMHPEKRGASTVFVYEYQDAAVASDDEEL
jgi:hypothetical protein